MSNKNLTTQQLHNINRSNIFKGTLLLTLAGLITRIIGFFYKIFLSNTMGAERLGIYQLIFPVYGICFTIYATGVQTAISRLVAFELAKRNSKNVYRILKIGLVISVSLALILSILVHQGSTFIAQRFLLEPRSADSVRIMAYVFPFCAVTSCINGYYYGLKRAGVPASTQLLEQIVRVLVVYLIATLTGQGDLSVTCEHAVIGIVLGEICSCIYNAISLLITKSPKQLILLGPDPRSKVDQVRLIVKKILHLSIPLSTNRLLINVLHSIETIMIPTMLRRSGLSISQALSTYGILNGMSMPFIMFPTALINGLAVLLLPTVSEAQALNNGRLIGKTTSVSIKYSLIIGIVSTGIFVIFGNDLGNAVFHSEEAGSYLRILAWLCPLIYLTTTLGSIINGLGKAHITLINGAVGTLSKIILIIILIPRMGITGTLIAMLLGQLIITILDGIAVGKNISFDFEAANSLVKPGLIVFLFGFLLKESYIFIKKMAHINEVILILTFCFIYCAICLGFLILTKAISKKDFK